MTRYKINDYFEFPLELDMNKYTSDYINEKNQNNNKYLLRGLVVHYGSCESGHYYAIIKNIDTKNEDWYKYNDSYVTKFDINNLKEEAFGDKIIEEKNDNNLNNKKDNQDNNINNNKDNKNNDNESKNNKEQNKENNIIKENNIKNERSNINLNNNIKPIDYFKQIKENESDKKTDYDKNDNANENEMDISFNNKIDGPNKNNNAVIVNIKNYSSDSKKINNTIETNKINNNKLLKKMGKSAYLLFYEKIDQNVNCEKFDKIEAITNIPKFPNIPDNKKKITASYITLENKKNFLEHVDNSENSQLLKNLNDEIYKYYLSKKLFSNEYHKFLLGFYINLLYYYSPIENKIKRNCGTPIYFCSKNKDSIYSDKNYFYRRGEKNIFSNLYYSLSKNKIKLFKLKNANSNCDENHNNERILKLFKHLLIFFFNIKIRTSEKKYFGEYVDLIKLFINSFPSCCEYFLEEFTTYNVIVEYLINCKL